MSEILEMTSEISEAARTAVAAGVTLYDFIRAHNEAYPLSDMEKRCVAYAEEHLYEDLECEIDDPPFCSTGSKSGTYVMSWVWVDDPEPEKGQP